jgi:hypothetical protein
LIITEEYNTVFGLNSGNGTVGGFGYGCGNTDDSESAFTHEGYGHGCIDGRGNNLRNPHGPLFGSDYGSGSGPGSGDVDGTWMQMQW